MGVAGEGRNDFVVQSNLRYGEVTKLSSVYSLYPEYRKEKQLGVKGFM